jgi:hypothetical protein
VIELPQSIYLILAMSRGEFGGVRERNHPQPYIYGGNWTPHQHGGPPRRHGFYGVVCLDPNERTSFVLRWRAVDKTLLARYRIASEMVTRKAKHQCSEAILSRHHGHGDAFVLI